MPFVRNAWKILGLRGTLLLLFGSIGGLILSSVDLGFTLLLHSLFHKLGIQEPSISEAPLLETLSSPMLAAALLGVGIARNLGLFMVNNAAITAQKIASTRLRLIVFHVSLDNNAASPLSPSDIQHAIHEVFPKTAAFFRQTALCFGNSLYALGLLAVMAYHAPWLCLAATVGMLLFTPLVAKSRHKIRTSAARVPFAHKELMRGIERVSQNWLFLRVMRLLDKEKERLVKHTLSLNNETLKISRMTLLVNSLVSLLGLLLLVGALFLAQHLETLPGIATVAFVYLFIRLVQTLGALASTLNMLISVRPQFESCCQFLRSVDGPDIRAAVAAMRTKSANEDDSNRSLPKPNNEKPAPLAAPAVTLRQLSFSYGNNTPLLFEHISLELMPGEVCALVGPSGSGKTTVLSLVAGLLQPTSGEILVDGVPPQEFFGSGQGRVGFVGSIPYLVAGTIRENLCLGLSWEPSGDTIASALEAAKIADKVHALPDGLEHQLLSGGEGLSSGEKQRLCLARALLGQPNILFLDEMSANLDLGTEEIIAKSLGERKGACTILLATHRTTFLALADRTIALTAPNAPKAETREE